MVITGDGMTTELHYDYNLSESWSNVIAITQEIESMASDQLWESMIDVVKKRHQLVLDHFQRFPVSPETAEFYTENLSTFMQHEENLQFLVKQARSETMQIVNQFNHNRQAVSAYHSV